MSLHTTQLDTAYLSCGHCFRAPRLWAWLGRQTAPGGRLCKDWPHSGASYFSFHPFLHPKVSLQRYQNRKHQGVSKHSLYISSFGTLASCLKCQALFSLVTSFYCTQTVAIVGQNTCVNTQDERGGGEQHCICNPNTGYKMLCWLNLQPPCPV